MIKSIQGLLRAGKHSQNSKRNRQPKLERAAASLLFEVARADGEIDQTELALTAEILRRQFGLSQKALLSLSESTIKRSSQYDKQKIARDIRQNWGNAKRMKLLEHLWIVALANDEVAPNEELLIREIAASICLTEMQVSQTYEDARHELDIQDF